MSFTQPQPAAMPGTQRGRFRHSSQQPMLPFTHFGAVCTQKEHSILFGTLSCVFLWEQEHVQGNLSRPSPTPPPKCYCPLHHEDHFWPLTALTAPQAPADSHLSGLQTWGFIDWFGIVLLRLAYLSLQLCLHHKKIISCDYLLFLICSLCLFSSHSLSLSVPISVSVLSISTSLRSVVA